MTPRLWFAALLAVAAPVLADQPCVGVTVRADLGVAEAPVSQVRERVMGVQGTPQDVDNDPVEYGYVVALGANWEVSLLGDPESSAVVVRRDCAGRVVVEFEAFDAYIRQIGALTGRKPRMLSVDTMPSALSICEGEPHAYACNPRDWDEWRDVVRQVVCHLKDVLGFQEINLALFSEAMTRSNYAGYGGPENTFPAYMDLAEHTIEAAHSVDPHVNFELPGSPVYDEDYAREINPYYPWGLDDLLPELKRRVPGIETTGTFRPAWQGYTFGLDEDMMRGVLHIQDLLERNGFPRDTPQAIHGYGKWPYATSGTRSEEAAASYFAANAFGFVHSHVPVFADYYTMYLDTPNPEGAFYRDALYQVPHDGWCVIDENGAHCVPPAETHRRNLPYCVMQVLGNLRGQIMRSRVIGDPSDGHVATLVARDRDVVQVAVANNLDDCAMVTVELAHSPYPTGALFDEELQRVDSLHSNDGDGLEPPGPPERHTAEGEVLTLPAIEMPGRSVVLVTLKRAQ